MRHIEIGLVLIVPWISYLLASIFKLSAIVCILFNGLAQSTYTKPNLSEFSRITIKQTYQVMTHAFETLVFIYVGIGFFSFSHLYSKVDPWAVVIFIGVTLIARVFNIVLMSALVNIPRLSNIVNGKKQFFLIYAGVRGAMAYALALKALKEFEGKSGEQMLIITLVFIAFTILYSSFTTNLAIVKCEILAEIS